jgi:hypothetical protein
MEGLCNCLPIWLKNILPEDINNPKCAHCRQDTSKDSNFAQVLAYTCKNRPGKIHFFDIRFHKNGICTHDFKTREDLITRVPSMKSINTNAILKEHAQTGSSCGYCGTGEQVKCKFPVCSRCRQFRYCNEECRDADYANHKDFCKSKALAMAQVKDVMIETRPIIQKCECFNAEDSRIYQKHLDCQCSANRCYTNVAGPTHLAFYATECTIYGGMHMIPEQFCSDRCRKKSWKQKKG